MKAFKGRAIISPQLNRIVFQTPFVVLERDGLVHLCDKLGDREVCVGGHGPDKLDLGKTMAAYDQPQPQLFVGHNGALEEGVVIELEAEPGWNVLSGHGLR